MNLKDLSNIDINDLKNIDIRGVQNNIRNRPDIVINVLLIVVTILASIFIYTKQKTEAKKLKNDIEKSEKKLAAVKLRNKIEEEHDTFLSTFPESLNVDEFITMISDYAVNRNIQIQSFSPTKRSNYQFSWVESTSVSISAENYKDIVLFVQDIENSEHNVRIAIWNGTLGRKKTRRRGAPSGNNTVSAKLKIESVGIKK